MNLRIFMTRTLILHTKILLHNKLNCIFYSCYHGRQSKMYPKEYYLKLMVVRPQINFPIEVHAYPWTPKLKPHKPTDLCLYKFEYQWIYTTNIVTFLLLLVLEKVMSNISLLNPKLVPPQEPFLLVGSMNLHNKYCNISSTAGSRKGTI